MFQLFYKYNFTGASFAKPWTARNVVSFTFILTEKKTTSIISTTVFIGSLEYVNANVYLRTNSAG